MSIQFLCPACSQPIEIDDEWSARPVACPYCRKTITAPESSTDAIIALADLVSPTSAFVRDRCLTGPGERGLGRRTDPIPMTNGPGSER